MPWKPKGRHLAPMEESEKAAWRRSHMCRVVRNFIQALQPNLSFSKLFLGNSIIPLKQWLSLFFGIFYVNHFLKSLLNLLQYCLFNVLFFGHEAYATMTPPPEIELTRPAMEGQVLTTGPPGTSQLLNMNERICHI